MNKQRDKIEKRVEDSVEGWRLKGGSEGAHDGFSSPHQLFVNGLKRAQICSPNSTQLNSQFYVPSKAKAVKKLAPSLSHPHNISQPQPTNKILQPAPVSIVAYSQSISDQIYTDSDGGVRDEGMHLSTLRQERRCERKEEEEEKNTIKSDAQKR